MDLGQCKRKIEALTNTTFISKCSAANWCFCFRTVHERAVKCRYITDSVHSTGRHMFGKLTIFLEFVPFGPIETCVCFDFAVDICLLLLAIFAFIGHFFPALRVAKLRLNKWSSVISSCARRNYGLAMTHDGGIDLIPEKR